MTHKIITTLKVGSRTSPLALCQVKEVKRLFERAGVSVTFDLVTALTEGDKDKKTPLTGAVPDNFFTDALDEALLNGRVDIAIHSAKDVPQKLHTDLAIYALTEMKDDTDALVAKCPLAELPSGARIGTSSTIREKNIKALRPDCRVVPIRGTIAERVALVEEGACDAVIVATIALKRLGLEHLIKDIMPWEGAPLQSQLAIVGLSAREDLRELCAPLDARRKYGMVTLIGAGPGDPELITLKGIKALKQADCVFYDYLVDKAALEHAPKAEHIFAGKRKGEHSLPQRELCRMLKQKALEGKNVARLKGGDPLVFGRGGDEIQYLRSYHIPVEVIPGVSSATAIPSRLGVPLTARGLSSSVAFLSGYQGEENEEDPRPIHIPAVDTLVFLMGLTKLSLIVRSLREQRWKDETPVLVVSQGTTVQEKIVHGTLATIERLVADANVQPPALIIVGPTVAFWQPASHPKNVLFTGTNPTDYAWLGKIVHHPMISIRRAAMNPEVSRMVKALPQYDVICFTSRYGVCSFFDILKEAGVDQHSLRLKTFIVIGEHTGEALREQGYEPHLTAQVETAEGMFKDMAAKMDLSNKRILLPRSSLPNPSLSKEMRDSGLSMDTVTVYETGKPDKRALPQKDIDGVVFTSPSTVKHFLEDYGAIPKAWRILSKGPLTSKALQEAGYHSEGTIHESV